LEALENLYRTTKDVRLRTRAQIVLLAGEQRMTAPAIAAIMREVSQTVRNWLKRWMAEGIEGLKDRPMPGPPPKITEKYQEELLAAVRRRPRSLGQPYSMWTLQRLSDYMAEQTGIRCSGYLDYPFQNKRFGYGFLAHFSHLQHLIFSKTLVC
jgi:transposase